MKTQQTAVEWLEEQLNKWSDGRFYLPPHLFEQTKQMEKEQILNARLDGFKISGEGFNGEYPYEGQSDDSISNSINNEQYYNETYNK